MQICNKAALNSNEWTLMIMLTKPLFQLISIKQNVQPLSNLAAKFSSEYELYFAIGGDQNNDSIPEVPVCKEKGIRLLEGLGDKI